MINENSFINQKLEEGMETSTLNKEQVQNLLFERYKIRKTSDFQAVLKAEDFQRAEDWLEDIENNDYVQYRDTRESFLSDRRRELALYQQWSQDGTLEKIEFRSNKEVEDELERECGIRDTDGFRKALIDNIVDAEKFLNYVVEHKYSMTKYLANWDNWLADRQRELAQVKK